MFKVALSSDSKDSKVFFNDEVVDCITGVQASQDADGELQLTLHISAPTVDQLSIIADTARIITKCPRCQQSHTHLCRDQSK